MIYLQKKYVRLKNGNIFLGEEEIKHVDEKTTKKRARSSRTRN